MDNGEKLVRWEVRPCNDGMGNIRCYDICLPVEPDATGVAVVASVFSGKEVADDIVQQHNTRAATRPHTTGDSDLVERFARAMFEEWPLTAISPAIAERSGLPEGTVLTYDKVLEMGGNHDGLLRLAKGAAKLHTAIEATLSTQAAEIERLREALAYLLSAAEAVNDDNHCVVDPDAINDARQALSDTSGSAVNG